MSIESDKPPTVSPEVFAALPQEALIYIQFLERQIVLLLTQVQGLTVKVQELESCLAKNSSNSNKPPGSDGLKKPNKTASTRERSGRKPGGQTGHVGRTLEQVSNPDSIEVYIPESCQQCYNSLSSVESCGMEKRQVFDLPEIAVSVTEHRVEVKKCPCCGHSNKGKFPDHVTAPVQYGERTRALAAYFQHQHLIPFERLTQIFEDIYGIPLSPGTCSNIDKRLFKNLGSFERSLKGHLLACKVLHVDETGIRCEKKLHWIHVTASTSATLYMMHAKRGKEALENIGILGRYQGKLVHDHWFPYFAYEQVKHSLCNAHHLRELKYVHEQEKKTWAKKMSDLLLRAKKIADHAVEQGLSEIAAEQVTTIERDYANIILNAAVEYQEIAQQHEEVIVEESSSKQGLNLLKRLLRKMEAVLAFLHDLNVSFTKDLASYYTSCGMLFVAA
jgi:transposase